ncbi:tetratricopeptide repeat protein [Tahibacter soli]|uniref:Tetratricopeptide repeat protein n=1 Tax=Tahibacter soli TaxID=2983605 RepID=A0A9X3YFV6_9GAMM|nr:tetratricopeptide repeat protein [Tahibacter soli]MDC8010939.1 tetratricopeptide repeat protein [Tahibacter soli]
MIAAAAWWLGLALAASDPAPVERCRALQQREPREAIAACDAAFASLDVKTNAELAEEMLFRRSDAQAATGDFAAASATLDRAAAMPPDPARWMHDFRLERRRGILEYRQGRYAAALPLFRAARERAAAHDDATALGQSDNDIGNALRRIGSYREALAAYLSSLENKRRAGDKHLGALLTNLGDLYRDLGDIPASRTRYEEALVDYERDGRTLDRAHTLDALGTLMLDAKDHDAAARYLGDAQAAFAQLGARSDEMRICARLARLALDRGDARAADAALARGTALATELNLPPSPDLSLQAARAKRAAGDMRGAETLLAAALGRLAADAPERVALLQARAETAAAAGDTAGAYRTYVEFHAADAAHRDAEHDRELTELRVRFDVAEKERALQRLADENALAALSLRYRTSQLALVGALALAGFAVFAALFYRVRQRARAQAAALEAERDGYRRALEALGGDEPAAAGDADSEPEAVADAAPVPSGDDDTFRRDLVELMLATVEAWERATGTTRIELAEKSRVWRVTIDEGRLRVRAMERYLSLAKLPRQPRWREVLRSAYFVLSECALEADARADLRRRADAVQAVVRRRALR